jgi:hypothetical protein
MPDWASELLRYGPLGAFALAVCWGGWILIREGGAKAYTLGERYVASTEKLHDTLKESDEQQKELCNSHAASLASLDSSLAKSLTVQQCSCDHLETLVQAHSPRWAATVEVVNVNARDLQRVKAAVVQACEMCRVVAEKDFPASAPEVNKHCAEIERIIGEA